MALANQSDADRKREKRAMARLVRVPPCQDPVRRQRLEGNVIEWLRYYINDTFVYDPTEQQRRIITAILDAVKNGGDQAIAASRGEGKTTIAECVLTYCVLTGLTKFAVLFSATGTDARNNLRSIKARLEENDRLYEDYPEVCVPIRALENTPNRAHQQIIAGVRPDNGQDFGETPNKFVWCGDLVELPCVPGAASAGAIIATRGLDSAIRGLKIKNKRPDVAVIDDPDTKETVNSQEQADKLEDTIERSIAALGAQNRNIARVMLTTLQRKESLSSKYTDKKLKPSWRGERFKFLVHPPEREDLWEEYVERKQIDWQLGTDEAHEFYIKNRKEMERGAKVANPNRYVQGELSALQFYYNQVAKIGLDAVLTEYQNDPPDDQLGIQSGITHSLIQQKLSGYERGVVPPDCVFVTQGIDLNKHDGAHWVLRAWRADASFYTIDYGVQDSYVMNRDDAGIERAIVTMLHSRMSYLKDSPPKTVDGKPFPVRLTLVDSGWMRSAVFAAVKDLQRLGHSIYPSKGHGKSHGCESTLFTPVSKSSPTRKPGDGFYQSLDSGLWIVNCDTDRWKTFEHERWLTPIGKPGAGAIYGIATPEELRRSSYMPQATRDHQRYGIHLTAEIEVEDYIGGRIQRKWKKKNGRQANHWLDASYLSNVAAAMLGMSLHKPVVAMAKKKKTKAANYF